MSENANWRPVEPFDIDSGELDGLSCQQCFCLGVEWEMVASMVRFGKRFEKQVHNCAEQVKRLTSLAERHGYSVRTEWVNDDWVILLGEPSHV